LGLFINQFQVQVFMDIQESLAIEQASIDFIIRNTSLSQEEIAVAIAEMITKSIERKVKKGQDPSVERCTWKLPNTNIKIYISGGSRFGKHTYYARTVNPPLVVFDNWKRIISDSITASFETNVMKGET
jgi:hypothetical protein